MTARELMKVKHYQREFKTIFNKRLEIDFMSMKGIPGIPTVPVEEIDIENLPNRMAVDLNKLLDDCVQKYGASLERIRQRSKRLQVGAYTKERLAVREFCKIVIHLKGNINEAARLINRDRSVIYHYAGTRE
jgi:hypothetical protein